MPKMPDPRKLIETIGQPDVLEAEARAAGSAAAKTAAEVGFGVRMATIWLGFQGASLAVKLGALALAAVALAGLTFIAIHYARTQQISESQSEVLGVETPDHNAAQSQPEASQTNSARPQSDSQPASPNPPTPTTVVNTENDACKAESRKADAARDKCYKSRSACLDTCIHKYTPKEDLFSTKTIACQRACHECEAESALAAKLVDKCNWFE